MNCSTPDALNVMVVDDHHDTATLTSRILRSVGHTVWAAGTCAEALKIVKANAIDVAVMDLRLPDGDGCELLVDILSHYPVVAIAFSGHVATMDRTPYEAAGFTHFLAKPAMLEEIIEAVADASQMRRAAH